jgi:hypothetical protein
MSRCVFRPGLLAAIAVVAGCATAEPEGPPARAVAWVVTARHELVRINAGQPGRVLERRAVRGLAAGERLVGIDYRVARGVLYALGSGGQLYTLDTASGALAKAGTGVAGLPIGAGAVGFDFNPTVDRIRVVHVAGANLRLHPDTGAQVDGDAAAAGVQNDGALAYPAGDAQAGQPARVVAAAYTYNPRDEKLTTNFAIDARSGMLVTQGTREGVVPAVSPNTGRLYTVGALGTGALDDAAFDIADVDNAAYAALRVAGEARTRWYRIDLGSGRATPLGTLADGGAVVGIAIEP